MLWAENAGERLYEPLKVAEEAGLLPEYKQGPIPSSVLMASICGMKMDGTLSFAKGNKMSMAKSKLQIRPQ